MNIFPFTLNLDKIAGTEEYLHITKYLARHFKKEQYMPIKNFLGKIDEEDLFCLIDEFDERLEEFILIAEMLAVGEGLENSENEMVVNERVSMLKNYLVIEMLAREGAVKIYRENMSFGDDFADKIVVEKI